MGGQSHCCTGTTCDPTVKLQEQAVFFARRIERMETFHAATTGAGVARKMNELILAFNAAGVRYLLVARL